MKIFQLNLLSVFILFAIIGLGVMVPSLIIESIWNASSLTGSIDRDYSIELWQASLLWGSFLAILAGSGIFKFKVDFKTIDSIDIDKIDDPSLKDEIERMKAQLDKEHKKESPKDK